MSTKITQSNSLVYSKYLHNMVTVHWMVSMTLFGNLASRPWEFGYQWVLNINTTFMYPILSYAILLLKQLNAK